LSTVIIIQSHNTESQYKQFYFCCVCGICGMHTGIGPWNWNTGKYSVGGFTSICVASLAWWPIFTNFKSWVSRAIAKLYKYCNPHS